ncbi:hypothetical protein MVEG_01898 [Podila verticillata NRRL 6337]|nr:hypothetical protein MVEG_01898 [Podila verticillata NRRL 6337]
MKIAFLLAQALFTTFALAQSSSESSAENLSLSRPLPHLRQDRHLLCPLQDPVRQGHLSLAHVEPQIHGPSAIPPEFIKGLNFYLLELYQYRKKIHVITNVYESDKLLGVYGYGVLKRNQPLAYFDLEANNGTAVDARWRNSLAVMPDVIGFRNARCVQAALDTGMAGNVTIKPWQLFANPKLLWSLDEFKETAHTSAGADFYWILVEAEDKEDALDAAQSTAMRVMVNTMAQNRYSNTLYTCPEGHSLEVTAMAYSLLPNSLDPKKIPVDY